MKVAAVIDTLTWGGAELLLTDLASAAPAAGLELSVTYLKDLDGSPAAAPLRSAGLEPALVPMTRLADPRGAVRVRERLRSLEPDVVHTHLGYADLLAGGAARSLGIPSVSTLHVMHWSLAGREGLKSSLFALARRRTAARVIAVSEAGRRAYLERGWDSADRVVTIHNGIARSPCPGEGPRIRRELGLEPGDLVAAMVTVLRPGKGHDVAARAVAELADPRLKLLVLGDGPGRAEVERLLAPLGDRAVMAGHRDDVMAVLDAVDVLLHPTRWDALPTAVMEAMAAGVPVVATAVGGIPEMIGDRETGMLVPAPPQPAAVGAALRELLRDDALRARLGTEGRRRFAGRFSADRWAGRLRQLYEAVS